MPSDNQLQPTPFQDELVLQDRKITESWQAWFNLFNELYNSLSSNVDEFLTSNGIIVTNMTQSAVDSIEDPTPGLSVYNTNLAKIQFYNGSSWETVASS